MQITITLEDSESGHVRLDTAPDTKNLVEIARGERDKITPALAYAMKAISSIMKDSVEQGQREGGESSGGKETRAEREGANPFLRRPIGPRLTRSQRRRRWHARMTCADTPAHSDSARQAQAPLTARNFAF